MRPSKLSKKSPTYNLLNPFRKRKSTHLKVLTDALIDILLLYHYIKKKYPRLKISRFLCKWVLAWSLLCYRSSAKLNLYQSIWKIVTITFPSNYKHVAQPLVVGEVILSPNRIIAKDVKSCTSCCYIRCSMIIVWVRWMPWLKTWQPITRHSKNFQTKVVQSKGCNNWDLEPLNLLNGLA